MDEWDKSGGGKLRSALQAAVSPLLSELEVSALVSARDVARDAERAGDLFAAYDWAVRSLESWPEDLELRYLSVLALARLGATELAERRFKACGFETDQSLPFPFDVDVPALGARLMKDSALLSTAPDRMALLAKAARAYRSVLERCQRTRPESAFYPAINAAALSLWAGSAEEARTLALTALNSLKRASGAATDYWAIVTEAEALLILGDREKVGRVLVAAGAKLRGEKTTNWQDVASTRRQLRRTCRQLGIGDEILNPLQAPDVVAYSGHMIGKRFKPEFEPAVVKSIRACLDEKNAIAGYGSLAGGSDVLFAEALLERDAELHIVFPFTLEDFVRQSVEPCGASWVVRFEQCLAKATTVRYATEDRYQGDAATFHYGTRLAMGRALVRARVMDAAASLIAVWDGESQEQAALSGTAADVAFWHSLGHSVDVISPQGRPGDGSAFPAWVPEPATHGARINAAILFGDIHGFSSLKDANLQSYVTGVLGTIATVLAKYEAHILATNTWGDAFFAVVDDVRVAAACATEIQSALAALDTDALQLPGRFLMRIGGHYGPVQRAQDPVSGRPTYLGIQVVQAARIEPVTESGMIWVTEAFAAALELHANAPFACDYLGMVDLAKGFGRQPLYWLHSR